MKTIHTRMIDGFTSLDKLKWSILTGLKFSVNHVAGTYEGTKETGLQPTGNYDDQLQHLLTIPKGDKLTIDFPRVPRWPFS